MTVNKNTSTTPQKPTRVKRKPPSSTAQQSSGVKKPKQAKQPQQGERVDRSEEARSAQKPNQSNLPNFGSWASPNAAKSNDLKPLSGDTLERRSKGDNVSQLQNHLNSAGAKLEVDGKFGPQTQKAVRAFQKKHNLEVDGKVGPETMAALNKGMKPDASAKPDAPAKPETAKKPDAPAKPETAKKPDAPAQPETAKKPDAPAKPETAKKPDAPAKVDPTKKAEGLPQIAGKNLTPQEKYDHYAAMVKAAGGKIDPNKPTVLGLRGLGLDGKRHDSGKNTGSNDDTFVVLGKDKKGNPTVTELTGATHAATARGSIAGGVAQLRPGNYDVTRRHDYKGHEAWAVNGGGNVPAYRDGNRDGRISDAEKAAAVKKGTTADGILFHWDRSASIGCQVLPVDQLKKLKAAVNGGNFHYTLLDANQAQ